jgi:uncharacterized protein YfbU (UPF0304 family)
MTESVKLTRLERYSLSLQLRLLEAAYPNEADAFSKTREAIENGYELLYGWDMDYIADGDDIMSSDECKEVWDTLEMFDAIERATRNSNDPEILASSFTSFMGYDGNNESKFMSFARFTMERMGRFEYVKLPKDKYWNSHMPVLDIYRRMLAVWHTMDRPSRMELDIQDVKRILAAATHPQGRREGRS